MRARARPLTKVERDYILDAARGLTAQQSARHRNRSVNTVIQGLKYAKWALGAQTLPHATALAIAYGEIGPDDLKEEAS